MSRDFEAMASNIIEMAYAVDNNHVPLIANWAERRIYASSVGWGRLWQWLYFPVAKDFQQRKLYHALDNTQKIFRREIASLEDSLTQYKANLGDETTDPNMRRQWQKNIIQWSERLGMVLYNQKLIDAVNSIYKRRCLSSESFLFSSENQERLAEACSLRAIIDVEGATGEPLPLAILKSLMQGKQLTVKQSIDLSRWCDRLGRTGLKVNVTTLHRALCTLAQYGFMEEKTIEDVGNVEWELIKHGCHILNESDSQHKKWRNELKLGDGVICNGKVYHLKGVEKRNQDYVVFTIKEEDQKLLIIGKNKAILGIHQQRVKERGWGIPVAEIYAIDNEGRCAIIEKLEKPVTSHHWQSNSDSLTPDDKRHVQPLCHLLWWLCEQERSPRNFFADDLWYDKDGNIKSSKILNPGPFDFNSLERLALECSCGNRSVYRFLMKESGLTKHSINKFYLEMMQQILRSKIADVSLEAALRRIGDGKVVARARELVNDVKKFEKQCINRLQSNYAVTADHDELEKLVSDQIIVYLEGGISMIDTALIEEIVEGIVRFKRWQPAVQYSPTEASEGMLP